MSESASPPSNKNLWDQRWANPFILEASSARTA